MPTALSHERLRSHLQKGLVIPACPLALTAERRFDERHQRALVRYYVASGAGGLAVGVHTTQFEIHDPLVGLYRPVLELAAETVSETETVPFVRVAGLVGDTAQALREAELARMLGYDCGLLSLSAFKGAGLEQILAHCQAVAQVIPLFGFYLQPAVGGRVLPYVFWRRFAEIEQVVAIKIAPFSRYQTLDVVRAVAESGRGREIALYTGNDDYIVGDLLTEYSLGPGTASLRIAGGLLGHWAVWTRRAVDLLEQCKQARDDASIPAELLALGAQVTDCNAALFDAANHFAGCIAGIHEVLRRQGLMAGRWCLNPDEDLSPGQLEEIDRVCAAYPHLNDDTFVREQLDAWLS
ncbi:MAG: dihydrodipicolinate synthase family protein [Anaerolineae bacterium]|nr:dihydrodipicolinate synthase family protein [Anaerolineae bacterium]